MSRKASIPQRSTYQKSRRAMPRSQRVTIMLNESEMRALNRYVEKYGITNRSRLIREALMMNILKRFDADSPTLFDEPSTLLPG